MRERDEPFDTPPGHAAGPSILTVGELTARIKALLAGEGRVVVEGEVTGLKRATSGHLYFSLKDRLRGVDSVLGCALWRSQVERATRGFEVENGAHVLAHGRLDVYAPRGTYSLIVDRLEARGMGALLVQLEELKRELRELGWFDRHRPLPRLPRTVGVVTSRDGAAFQDFLRTRSLRWPLYPVRLAHTPVQGPGAAAEIAAAIARLDASGVDVIVVCRGGGSLEDLWAFNERPVAEAIRAAGVPVVSGVGHETDTTLADLVADRRAHTPTDAAQTVLPDRAALLAELERQGAHLLDAIDGFLYEREERVARAGRARVLRDAGWILEDRRRELERAGREAYMAARALGQAAAARLAALATRLERHAPARRVEQDGARVEELGRRLTEPLRARLDGLERRLELAGRSLGATSPFAVLRRGYSITCLEGGAPVLDPASVAKGARLETRVAHGTLVSTVEGARGLSDEEREARDAEAGRSAGA